VTAESTEGIIDSYAPGSATPRSRRGAGRFAELPIAWAAFEVAAARHAGQYREIDHAPFIAHPVEVAA
jgi:(p)ppGpp synthase/HD superfamily hydrolase